MINIEKKIQAVNGLNEHEGERRFLEKGKEEVNLTDNGPHLILSSVLCFIHHHIFSEPFSASGSKPSQS